jgi:hypothetical protein
MRRDDAANVVRYVVDDTVAFWSKVRPCHAWAAFARGSGVLVSGCGCESTVAFPLQIAKSKKPTRRLVFLPLEAAFCFREAAFQSAPIAFPAFGC